MTHPHLDENSSQKVEQTKKDLQNELVSSVKVLNQDLDLNSEEETI